MPQQSFYYFGRFQCPQLKMDSIIFWYFGHESRIWAVGGSQLYISTNWLLHTHGRPTWWPCSYCRLYLRFLLMNQRAIMLLGRPRSLLAKVLYLLPDIIQPTRMIFTTLYLTPTFLLPLHPSTYPIWCKHTESVWNPSLQPIANVFRTRRVAERPPLWIPTVSLHQLFAVTSYSHSTALDNHEKNMPVCSWCPQGFRWSLTQGPTGEAAHAWVPSPCCILDIKFPR